MELLLTGAGVHQPHMYHDKEDDKREMRTVKVAESDLGRYTKVIG